MPSGEQLPQSVASNVIVTQCVASSYVAITPSGKDNDGVWDILDRDSDNDGILNVDEGFECETVDLSAYETGDALSNFNSAGITIGGSLMQVETPLQFGGSASLDEYAISDRHNGIDHGLLLGVQNSNGPNQYLSATYTFSTPVCGFNGTILDVDRTDAVQIIGRSLSLIHI